MSWIIQRVCVALSNKYGVLYEVYEFPTDTPVFAATSILGHYEFMEIEEKVKEEIKKRHADHIDNHLILGVTLISSDQNIITTTQDTPNAN